MNTSASKKNWFKALLIKLAYFTAVFAVLVLAGEITARCLGYKPLQETVQDIKIQPEGRFFQEDALLGYRGKPGRFDLLLMDSLAFTVTHDAEGWRQPEIDAADTSQPEEIWFLGCSFTHGYGVNDAETYPAIIQMQLPQYRIRNFAMDGYGTLQNWLTLKSELAKGKHPALVVLGYGAFHEQRNTANRYWHKALHGQRIADDIRYPYIRLDKNDSLHINYDQLQYHPLPFQKQLALLSLIEERWNKSEDQGLRSKFVTTLLIQRMVEATRAAGGQFILAGIYNHPETTTMLRTFSLDAVPTIDISQDLDQKSLRILPGNGHPNATAHLRMAKALLPFIQQRLGQ